MRVLLGSHHRSFKGERIEQPLFLVSGCSTQDCLVVL
jgi:hypothetical protein